MSTYTHCFVSSIFSFGLISDNYEKEKTSLNLRSVCSEETSITFNREHWTGEVSADERVPVFPIFIGRWYDEKNILYL